MVNPGLDHRATSGRQRAEYQICDEIQFEPAPFSPLNATASTPSRIPLQVSNLPDQGEQLRAGSMIGWLVLNS